MGTFEGTYTALVTPLREDRVDEQALRDLVERQIEGGVDGLVPCGTTGESVTLRGDEIERVVRVVVEQTRGRVPVVAGTGTNCTTKSIDFARLAREVGADGLMVVNPYYNKPTQAGLEAHFRAIAAEVPLPTMLYNNPGRTGVDLKAETVERLTDCTPIVAIKEATGNVVRAQQILARCGERFTVLAGDDALELGVLGVGGKGVVSVAANLLPAEVSQIARAWRDGRVAEAQHQHRRMLPLYDALFVEPNPAPIKAALAMQERIAPEIRLPLTWPVEQSRQVLREAMDVVGARP
jgi:4-hydroxy-tetrahydrodipicolinate synthase